MRLTVFGATGGIGKEVVRQALDAGDEVTAVVRDAARLGIEHPRLRVFTVEGLDDPGALTAAVQGSDAVVSGLGARSAKDITVASSTARVVLKALQLSGVRRFVAVSAYPVGPNAAGEGWLQRRVLLPLLRRALRGVYGDLAVMEGEISRSGTDWTVVRPPRLVNGPLTGVYRTIVGSNLAKAGTISRADVAHCMLATLRDPATFRQPVGVGH